MGRGATAATRLIAAVALLGGVLIAWTAVSTPGLLQTRSWMGLAAVEAMLGVYAVLLSVAGPRTSRSFGIALPFGLLAGAIYVTEIGMEYALTPADNTAFGLAEFGLVFVVFVTAGAIGAWRARSFRVGCGAAVWTAMISAAIWYAALIAAFLVFRGSERQQLIFQAEGDLEDFRRSGGGDFAQWIVQDFFGAGFFHLLLAPIIAAILGSVGAGLGLIAARISPTAAPVPVASGPPGR